MASRFFLNLSKKQHDDVALLSQMDTSFIPDCCGLALQLLQKGVTSTKAFNGAAQKLDVHPDQVRNAIDALCYVFTEAAKVKVGEAGFDDILLQLKISDKARPVIVEFYVSNMEEIRTCLESFKLDLPHYHHLDWRLNVDIGSRSRRGDVNPHFTWRLHIADPTKKSEETSVEYLSADVATMKHVCEELQSALDELNNPNYRRVTRYIK